MKAKRLTLALIVALLISGSFTFWLSKRLAKPVAVTLIQKHLYVAAGKALDAGEALKAADLKFVEWPTSAPLAGGFTRIEDVAGRIVLYPLPKDEPILDRQLAAAGAGVGLTAKIPSGMRAISVRSDEVVGVAGFLLPGTHVDVLLTYHAEKSPDTRTATVLQDVVVLAAGQQIQPDPQGKPASVNNVVTLLLTPTDAESLVLATSLGAIHFVLRNGTDKEQTSSPSVGLEQLAGTGPLSGDGSLAPTKLLHHKPRPYEVETILGNKQVVNGFD
jgi:pilus assembly protein CpaB